MSIVDTLEAKVGDVAHGIPFKQHLDETRTINAFPSSYPHAHFLLPSKKKKLQSSFFVGNKSMSFASMQKRIVSKAPGIVFVCLNVQHFCSKKNA